MLRVIKRYQTLALVAFGAVWAVYTPLVLAEQLNSTLSTTAGSVNPDHSIRFNNKNWFTVPNPEPVSFIVTSTGEMYGTTTNGIPFRQVNIKNAAGLRIQEFIIQDHNHYIVEGEVVYTTHELSKKISMLY